MSFGATDRAKLYSHYTWRFPSRELTEYPGCLTGLMQSKPVTLIVVTLDFLGVNKLTVRTADPWKKSESQTLDCSSLVIRVLTSWLFCSLLCFDADCHHLVHDAEIDEDSTSLICPRGCFFFNFNYVLTVYICSVNDLAFVLNATFCPLARVFH